jgi:choline dehydrogenase-like flavoprotein
MYQTEHAPHRDSRVVLAGERDGLGMRRITVRPAFGDVDVKTVVELHRVMSERFEKTGAGMLEYDEDVLRQSIQDSFTDFNSQAHQLGTTRMSRAVATGVVDTNCQVHDVHGLFVIGGSVFSTGGHANPTLTIVALAARLAAHLAGERGVV